MLLIKTYSITPKQRWRKYLKFLYCKKFFFHKFTFIKKNKKIKKKLIRGIHFFKKNYFYQFFNIKVSIFNYIIQNFGYQKRPIREFAFGKNIFNQMQLFLFTEHLYPGFKLYNLNYLLSAKYSLINQILPLWIIPINSAICYLFNVNNQNTTYAKSSGCNAFKKKNVKKSKLCYVELPSKKLKLLPLYVYCVFSNNKNFFYNKLVEGGWGYTQKSKKLVSVRGVAKNPVDHPQGGRTKAKQPELSPWGWIAKKNK